MRDRSLSHNELLASSRYSTLSTLRERSSIDSQKAALIAARAALEKLAEDAVVMDLRSLSTVADYFVICTGNSARQLDAIKNHIEDALGEQSYQVWHSEGATTASDGPSDAPQWVLMDCGDFVVHLFDQKARSFYRLEDLWADAPRLSLGPSPSASTRLK